MEGARTRSGGDEWPASAETDHNRVTTLFAGLCTKEGTAARKTTISLMILQYLFLFFILLPGTRVARLFAAAADGNETNDLKVGGKRRKNMSSPSPRE